MGDGSYRGNGACSPSVERLRHPLSGYAVVVAQVEFIHELDDYEADSLSLLDNPRLGRVTICSARRFVRLPLCQEVVMLFGEGALAVGDSIA